MDLLMNGLLLAATLFAGGYCWVLSRRVEALKSLDKGLGGSIVTLTRQIELARLTLDEAKAGGKDRRQDLAQLVTRAEAATGQLRLLLAVVPPAAELPLPPVRQPDLRATREATPASHPTAIHPAPSPTSQPAAEPEAPATPILRAVPDLPAAEPERTPETRPTLAEVPKPRVLSPVENPLRRARGTPGAPVPASAPLAATTTDEADLLEALSALAGTGAR